MLALHDCTLVALVGCMFKSCGKGGGCGLQFGGSSSNISSTSSMANNRSKSFGATLTRCFITSCGEVSGGASLEVVAGSNVQLQRCTVAFSLGVSIHVDQSSTILLNKCSIYAAAAAALVFGEKSTGQVLFCQVLSSSGNGLELQGYINLWFHNVWFAHNGAFQVLQMLSLPAVTSVRVEGMVSVAVAVAKPPPPAFISEKMLEVELMLARRVL
jgi:hypothetical protein